MSFTSDSTNTLISYSAQKRAEAFYEIVKQQQAIYILNDQHGAVMLVAEDEDCIPVWPTEESALLWRDQEWSHCEAKAIPLSVWLERWTRGLLDDDLGLVVFPVPGESAEVTMPDEFEWMLKK